MINLHPVQTAGSQEYTVLQLPSSQITQSGIINRSLRLLLLLGILFILFALIGNLLSLY